MHMPHRIALIVMILGSVCNGVLIPAEKEHVISLNGAWRFRLEPTTPNAAAPERYARDLPKSLATTEPSEAFYREDFHEDEGWHDLTVPGNWEMAGFSPATYWQPD